MIKVKFNDSATSYYVNFRRISADIVKLIGDGLPQNTSGFHTFTENDEPLGDFSGYKTIYSVNPDGLSFSDDGSTEPLREITISITWKGDEGSTKRPNQVNIVINKNGKLMPDILSEGMWAKTYKIKASEFLYLAEVEDVNGYNKDIVENTITFTLIKIDPVPPLDERVAELEEAVCELYEMLG